jgi:hypothetical protein
MGTLGAADAPIDSSGVVADGVIEAIVPAVAPEAAPAAAKLLDDGGVAGVNPATATASGFVCADGSTGVADRATADVSSGALSCFHQANRGADWQPATAATTVANANDESAVRFMSRAARLIKYTNCTSIRHGRPVTFTETRQGFRTARPIERTHALADERTTGRNRPQSGRIID